MVGRTYRWRGGYWRVVCRWAGRGPRNVLIEHVVPRGGPPGGPGPGVLWCTVRPAERVVRPFRGLRRIEGAGQQ